jgi:hypothetical protein
MGEGAEEDRGEQHLDSDSGDGSHDDDDDDLGDGGNHADGGDDDDGDDDARQVQKWVKELRKIVGSNISIAIAGNKCDLEKNRAVSMEDALS